MRQEQPTISSVRTVKTFLSKGSCSETLFTVLDRAFEQTNHNEGRASMPLAGGIVQHGYQCGMIWGATLAAGAQAYRLYGAGGQAESAAVEAALQLVESFRALNTHSDCFDLTHMDSSSTKMQLFTYFLLKGGTIGCFRMAARYAPVALKAINSSLSEQRDKPQFRQVSCAAELAKRMGMSEKQVVMCAGLAGGIGLSGGGCGALGAAIWCLGVARLESGNGKVEYEDASATALIEKFLKCTDYEFECAAIVGRKFTDISDHGEYLCSGGCSKVLDALAGR